MAIKIIDDGPDVYITRSEAARLEREWQKYCQYTVDPPTFEEFVRSRQQSEKHSHAELRDFLGEPIRPRGL